MTLPNKLKQLRGQYCITQLEMAEQLNKRHHVAIKRADIANWETDRHAPKWPQAIMLSKFFKVTLDQLFKDEIELPKPRQHTENRLKVA